MSYDEMLIINKLTKSSKTKIGAKAGVTRQQQWVRINPKLELLDTPGIIPTRQDNQEQALKLAFVSSVSENAYSSEPVARALLDMLQEKQEVKINKEEKFYQEDVDWQVGDYAYHDVFGAGRVVEVTNTLISIAFKSPHGIKKLMKNHKSLQKV